MVEPYKPIYTVAEAAKVLRTSKNKVYDLMRYGKLPYLQMSSKKIKGKDLERFIDTHPPGPTGEDWYKGNEVQQE